MENRGKIKICSKEALQAINDRCTKKLLDVVDGRNLSEDEKEKIKARIVAVSSLHHSTCTTDSIIYAFS